MFMWLSLSPESHILLVDMATQVAVSLITEENQVQQAMVVFNSFTDIFTEGLPFCFIAIGLLLENLNFVWKSIKFFMDDPQHR